MDIAFLATDRLETPAVSVRDRSFLLGDGCFETLFVHAGKAEGISEHLGLLRQSANTLGITGFPKDAALRAAIEEAASSASGDASIRITLSRGAGGRGADPGDSAPLTVISLSPLPHSRPFPPLTAITSTILRNETSPISRIKATNYADNLAARREAVAAGAGEALMLNTRGRPTCFAMGNLFLRSPDRRWLTPPPEEGVRPGYMRAKVIAKLKADGHAIEEAAISLDQLRANGACLFATNSLWGLRPVAQLDSHPYEIDMVPFGG